MQCANIDLIFVSSVFLIHIVALFSYAFAVLINYHFPHTVLWVSLTMLQLLHRCIDLVAASSASARFCVLLNFVQVLRILLHFRQITVFALFICIILHMSFDICVTCFCNN